MIKSRFNRNPSFSFKYEKDDGLYIAQYFEFNNMHFAANRLNLPAYFDTGGCICWISGRSIQYHCTTGPAIIEINGEIKYFLNDKLATVMEVWMT